MMELIAVIIVVVLIIAFIAVFAVGSTIMSLPWFAWVLIVAIVCGFKYLLKVREDKKEKANRQVQPYSDPIDDAFINKIIDKELASYEKKLKIDKSKVIEVKDKDKYFKLLK